MTVLIIDDSATMRRIVANVVGQLGIDKSDMTEAADGLIAWKLVQKNKYDIILSDINMPNMTGLEFVKKTRTEDNLCKSVPIVMITTEGGKGTVVDALRLGANNYIVKPFNADTLKEKVKLVIK